MFSTQRHGPLEAVIARVRRLEDRVIELERENRELKRLTDDFPILYGDAETEHPDHGYYPPFFGGIHQRFNYKLVNFRTLLDLWAKDMRVQRAEEKITSIYD